MANRHLITGCPTCAGTGKASYLRSGVWLNSRCPGRNGPQDVDSSPMTHELDHLAAKRKVRIEYKRGASDQLPDGQERHLLAELRSTRPDWKLVIILVYDKGQRSETDRVVWRWKTSSADHMTWKEQNESTIAELGDRLVAFLWPATTEGIAA